MRAIDAEALKKTLKSNCKPELCHDYGTNWCEVCCRYNDFEDLIDDAPTIEPNKAITEKMQRLKAENIRLTKELETAYETIVVIRGANSEAETRNANQAAKTAEKVANNE